MGEELAKVETGLVAFDYGDEATGFENQTQDDMSTPYLQVLQSNSPQCDPDQGSYSPEARAGMLYNTASGELYDGRSGGVLFVPSYTEHVYVEYRPRTDGGGYIGTHPASSELVREVKAACPRFNELRTDEGNELTETFYIYGIVVDGDPSDPATLSVVTPIIIPFASTKIRAYKKWVSSVRTHMVATQSGRRVNPPIFANLVRITTFGDENRKGKFSNIKLSPATGDLKTSLLSPESEVFRASQEFFKLVSSGQVKAAEPVQEGVSDTPTDVDGTPF